MQFRFGQLEALIVFISITDKFWPNDKYGFQFAYAIQLKTKWMIKRGNKEWEERSSDWKPSDEAVWCKFNPLCRMYSIKISHM